MPCESNAASLAILLDAKYSSVNKADVTLLPLEIRSHQ